MATKAELVLFLAPWQKRMVRDFMPPALLGGRTPAEITRIVLKYKPRACPASYKLGIDGIRKGDWLLYLTDEQMINVREHLKSNVQVPALNITTAFVKSGEVAFR